MFVGGEAGVGKTTLVRAFEAQAGLRVLRGSCENLATPTPLGPFVDIAAETGGALAELLAAGADPRAVARALLGELAEPAVVVIEDVHWADEATLDALRVLGSRIDGTQGLVVATYRDDEVEGEPSAARRARRARLRPGRLAARRAAALARGRARACGAVAAPTATRSTS